jgi:hypothetical protein
MKFNLRQPLILPYSDECFSVTPGAPNVQSPKLGLLHPPPWSPQECIQMYEMHSNTLGAKAGKYRLNHSLTHYNVLGGYNMF